jgi:hypothetical protein
MKLRTLALMICLVGVVTTVVAEERNWQTGTLTATEKQRVPAGSTITSNTDGSAKDRGDKTDYSQNTTTTKSSDYDTYQLYTIQSGNITYVASEHLFFPWSKPVSLTLGKPVKFAVENNTMYILDAEGKQHKASVVKSSLSTPTQ